MLAELKHTLRRLRGQILAWGIGLFLFSLMMAFFFSTMGEMEGLQEMIAHYPEEILAFFGDAFSLNTPQGYLDTYYFSMMTLILGIFAIGACAGLVVGDEEKGILDLVMAHPVSRTSLFWGRLLGFTIALLTIHFLGWLGWVVSAGGSGLDLTWVEFLRPYLSLFAVLLLFGTITLFFSLIVPAGRVAAMISGAILVGSYLLVGLARMNPDIESIARFTPLYYYQGGSAITELNWGWLIGLLAGSLFPAVAAWLLFRQREIRVGGERSWRFPIPAVFLKRSR
jgi:ABC-2 type transport system permease protein